MILTNDDLTATENDVYVTNTHAACCGDYDEINRMIVRDGAKKAKEEGRTYNREKHAFEIVKRLANE